MTHTGGIELNIGRFFFLDRSPSGGTPVPSNGDTGGVSVQSTECVEGHEVMDEDKTSDTEMTTSQGTFIVVTEDIREHR